MIATDEAAWAACWPGDRWLFDKLLVASHFGHLCGPCGVAVPAAGAYIVRPVMNLAGMGAGAEIRWLKKGARVEPGYFWCEVFTGPHISVDYDGFLKPVHAVRGIRKPGAPLYRWSAWVPAEPLPWPDVMLLGAYDRVNVEFIGGEPIEIHLRGNPDPGPCEVVWEGDGWPCGPNLIPAEDDADGYLPERRLGFATTKRGELFEDLTDGGSQPARPPI